MNKFSNLIGKTVLLQELSNLKGEIVEATVLAVSATNIYVKLQWEVIGGRAEWVPQWKYRIVEEVK